LNSHFPCNQLIHYILIQCPYNIFFLTPYSQRTKANHASKICPRKNCLDMYRKWCQRAKWILHQHYEG